MTTGTISLFYVINSLCFCVLGMLFVHLYLKLVVVMYAHLVYVLTKRSFVHFACRNTLSFHLSNKLIVLIQTV